MEYLIQEVSNLIQCNRALASILPTLQQNPQQKSAQHNRTRGLEYSCYGRQDEYCVSFINKQVLGFCTVFFFALTLAEITAKIVAVYTVSLTRHVHKVKQLNSNYMIYSRCVCQLGHQLGYCILMYIHMLKNEFEYPRPFSHAFSSSPPGCLKIILLVVFFTHLKGPVPISEFSVDSRKYPKCVKSLFFCHI